MSVIFIFVVFFGCIERLDLRLGETPILTIDGLITDQPGPHLVKLDFSTGFNKKAIFEPSRAETLDVTVQIIDDLGNVELLVHQGGGRYATTEFFCGSIGRSYRVRVVLKDGKEYTSIPEELLPVPEIENVRFKTEIRLVQDGPFTTPERFVIIGIDFKDDPLQTNFYRWRYFETYEVFAPLSKKICWANVFDHGFLTITDDLLFNGQNLRDFEVYGKKVDRRCGIKPEYWPNYNLLDFIDCVEEYDSQITC